MASPKAWGPWFYSGLYPQLIESVGRGRRCGSSRASQVACRNEFGRRKEAKDRSRDPSRVLWSESWSLRLSLGEKPQRFSSGSGLRHAAGRERGLGVGVGRTVPGLLEIRCKVRAEL